MLASVHHFGSDERNSGHALDIVNRSKMTHFVTSPPSLDALQNDQSLPRAGDIRLTDIMEYRDDGGLLWFDVS
jgi:hypothetical protein